ncbi:MAG: hypothetical protein VR72_12275 [Clostridiaceae bacterium BRH_c20a]|nr:MAG: hypothetical protein VR72_12275 [Clostridiaceae bacterium BRH_c20a]
MQNEWPLIIFTLLIQGSVGVSLVLLLIYKKIGKNKGIEKIIGQGFIYAGLLGVLGLAASFVHLGSPGNAMNAILRLGSSWMSREIIFTSIFIGLIILASLVYWKNTIKNSVILGWVAVVFGLLAIYAMAKVYMVTIIPAWNHINTLFAFYGTTFLLGALLAASLLVVQGKDMQELVRDGLKIAFGTVILALALQIVILPLYLTTLAAGDVFAQTTGQILSTTYSTLLVIRWLLVLVGGAVLAALIWVKLNTKEAGIPQNIIYSSFIMVFVAEVIGRYLFYASAVPITLGF